MPDIPDSPSKPGEPELPHMHWISRLKQKRPVAVLLLLTAIVAGATPWLDIFKRLKDLIQGSSPQSPAPPFVAAPQPTIQVNPTITVSPTISVQSPAPPASRSDDTTAKSGKVAPSPASVTAWSPPAPQQSVASATLASSANSSSLQTPSLPKLTTFLSPELWVGMTKADALRGRSTGVQWKFTNEQNPREFFVTKGELGPIEIDVYHYFRNNRLDEVFASLSSESSTLKLENPSQSLPDYQRSGLSEQAHATRCRQFYDQSLAVLLATYSMPAGGIKKTVSDDRAKVEEFDEKGDEVVFGSATTTRHYAKFSGSVAHSDIEFLFEEIQRVYSVPRKYNKRGVRSFTCNLSLKVR